MIIIRPGKKDCPQGEDERGITRISYSLISKINHLKAKYTGQLLARNEIVVKISQQQKITQSESCEKLFCACVNFCEIFTPSLFHVKNMTCKLHLHNYLLI